MPYRRMMFQLAVIVLFVVAAHAAALVLFGVPDSIEDISRLADEQDWVRLERSLDRYMKKSPNETRAILLRSRLFAARRQYADCAKTLDSVAADAPERAESLLRSGQAWLEAGFRRKAEHAWLECLKLSGDELELPPIHQGCRRELAGLYAMERRRDELWKTTDELARHSLPRDRHEAYAMRVRFEFGMVEPQIALGLLEPAVARDPADFATRRAIGLYYLEAGQADKARAELYRCIEARRDDPTVWEAWLRCLYQTADLFGLEQALRELPVNADESAECWKYRAELSERNGDLDAAVSAIQRAVQLRPDVPEYHHRLGGFMMRRGQKEEGQAHLARNQSLQVAMKTLRDAYEEYNRSFRRAVPTAKATMAASVAIAYVQLNRDDDAQAWHAVALAEDPAHAPSIEARERWFGAEPATP